MGEKARWGGGKILGPSPVGKAPNGGNHRGKRPGRKEGKLGGGGTKNPGSEQPWNQFATWGSLAPS